MQKSQSSESQATTGAATRSECTAGTGEETGAIRRKSYLRFYINLKIMDREKMMKQCLDKIDRFIEENVEVHKSDWFDIDRKRFIDDNLSYISIIGIRKTGSEIVFLDIEDERIGNDMDRVFGNLGNKKFLLVRPFIIRGEMIEEADFGMAFKLFCRFIPEEWSVKFDYGWEIVKNKKI